MPPSVARDPIQENCSALTLKSYPEFLTTSFSAGELQPSTQPAASAPVVAMMKIIIIKSTIQVEFISLLLPAIVAMYGCNRLSFCGVAPMATIAGSR